MRLIELIAAVAIFALSSVAFLGASVCVQKGVTKARNLSENAGSVIVTDRNLRKLLQETDVPYWKTLDGMHDEISGRIYDYAKSRGIEVLSVTVCRDDRYSAEGIRIEWKAYGKEYATQEFMKQRLVHEE